MSPTQQGNPSNDAQHRDGQHPTRPDGNICRSPVRVPQDDLKGQWKGGHTDQENDPGHGTIPRRWFKTEFVGWGWGELKLRGHPTSPTFFPPSCCAMVRNRLCHTEPLQTRSWPNPMEPSTVPSPFPAIQREDLRTLQVNLGYRCNQACSHCHVGAGPWREEEMDANTVALIPRVLSARRLQTLDLTGGAPELHPQFRQLVERASSLRVEVIDRCNLTILLESGQDDLADFLAAHRVTVIASLPCYQAATVDRQRGSGEAQSFGLRQTGFRPLASPGPQPQRGDPAIGPAALGSRLQGGPGTGAWSGIQRTQSAHQYADRPLRRPTATTRIVANIHGTFKIQSPPRQSPTGDVSDLDQR
jgi:hypothetical protein